MPHESSVEHTALHGPDQDLFNQFSQKLQEQRAQESNGLASVFKKPTSELLATTEVSNFTVGTGEQIIDCLIPAIQSAKSEVIIVTCFWAKSSSQLHVSNALQTLAKRAQAEGRLVSLKICFSSLSIWQKVTHTTSLDGHTYQLGEWPKMFGLPAEGKLMGNGEAGKIGVEMSVKSIFVRPMSVMHPKFIMVDRRIVFLPSCNVSWEDWFEGCIRLTGDIVAHFRDFYQGFWERQSGHKSPGFWDVNDHLSETQAYTPAHNAIDPSETPRSSIPCLFLPSEHHPDPQFRPFWFQKPPPAPSTALNIFLLTCFSSADKDIYIQTPNLTAPPVLAALVAALERGVNVRIVTSSKMMVFEQLATAGTITELCVKGLIKRYVKLVRRYELQRKDSATVEAQDFKPGRLSIRYYQPRSNAEEGSKEPVKSHLKLTIIDGRVVVLGSGNMDRASWFTSQELGVAFFSSNLAVEVLAAVTKDLDGRLGVELVK